jgi:CheY-like chemotaxis protein
VTLPLAATEAAAAAPAAATLARPARLDGAPRRRRVLVVDDNVDAAETLAQLVEAFGHSAEVAHDGASALAKSRANPPDAVLCDIGLPGMSGYDFAREVRAGAPGRMQLIAVSGYAQPEDVARARDAGFDAHVAKPPDPAEIERLLAHPQSAPE